MQYAEQLEVVRGVTHRRLQAADADDVAQNAMLRALGARDQLRDPNRLAAWLRSIARREVADFLRRSGAAVIRLAIIALCAVMAGCAAPVATQTPTEPPADPARRVFAPKHDGAALIAGISYGPFREGQRPGGPGPSDAELREDLHIIAKHWHMLRVYGSRGPTEAILRIIRDDDLPLVVLLGAWIAKDDPDSNVAEVEAAIRLANAYPDQVAAVSVGNETQVFWSWHRSPPEVLIGHLRRVRSNVAQPVTTADDYNFWNKPESDAVAAEVDFILLHAYAMWNGKSLEEAVPWTAEVVASIKARHPTLSVVLGETGWATELNPEGGEVEHIKAPAGESEQEAFYDAFTAWAVRAQQPYFYFEAFDEPWKGGDDPREVEKHWGLYRVDRTPKPALSKPKPDAR